MVVLIFRGKLVNRRIRQSVLRRIVNRFVVGAIDAVFNGLGDGFGDGLLDRFRRRIFLGSARSRRARYVFRDGPAIFFQRLARQDDRRGSLYRRCRVNFDSGFRLRLVLDVRIASALLGRTRGIGRLRRAVLGIREAAGSLATPAPASVAITLFLIGRGRSGGPRPGGRSLGGRRGGRSHGCGITLGRGLGRISRGPHFRVSSYRLRAPAPPPVDAVARRAENDRL